MQHFGQLPAILSTRFCRGSAMATAAPLLGKKQAAGVALLVKRHWTTEKRNARRNNFSGYRSPKYLALSQVWPKSPSLSKGSFVTCSNEKRGVDRLWIQRKTELVVETGLTFRIRIGPFQSVYFLRCRRVLGRAARTQIVEASPEISRVRSFRIKDPLVG